MKPPEPSLQTRCPEAFCLSHPPLLEANQVQIWLVEQSSLTDLRSLTLSLSEEEVKRCDRLKLDAIRRRFIKSRGTLRMLLAGYLGTAPHQIDIEYNPQGKPFVRQANNSQQLHFNLSHSEDLLLYAFTRVGETGIDIEQVRAFDEIPAISRRFFTSYEHAALSNESTENRPERFYSIWTRKEAYIKARGLGFSLPMQSFCVLDSTDGSFPEGSYRFKQSIPPFQFYTFRPQEGYLASLVVSSEIPLQIHLLSVS